MGILQSHNSPIHRRFFEGHPDGGGKLMSHTGRVNAAEHVFFDGKIT
jgi:hypothetical protein